MNLLIASTKLTNVARTAARAVRHEQGRRFQILNCCRLTAGGNLAIYGTDLDTGIAAAADCDVIEPGEAAVDARRLADIAAKLCGDVSIHTTSHELIAKCGRSGFTLTMQSLDDAPAPLAIEEDTPPIALSDADVMALFAGAAAGAASGDSHIYLSGPVLFGEPTDFGHRLCAVGADGVALSYAATTAACPDLGKGIIVHRDTCKLAVELFGETGASLRLSNNLVELASDSVRLTAKLIGAEPCAWRSFVPPADVTNTASVASTDLKAALQRCLAVTSDVTKRAPSTTVWWDIATGSEIRAAFGDIRNQAPAARDVVPAAELSGKIDVNVNPKLMLRLLERFDAENVRLSASDRSAPLRIDAGPDRFAVLSPMRDSPHVSEE